MTKMQKVWAPSYSMPRIKRADIKNIRVFKEFHVEFSPGLNIVSTLERGSGKSTLLALLARAVEPDLMLYGENVHRGAKSGHSRVEYEPFCSTFEKGGIPWNHGHLLISDFGGVKHFARNLPKEDCFLLELDWLIYEEKVPCKDILEVLSKARCQVIATVMEEALWRTKLPKGTKQIKI